MSVITKIVKSKKGNDYDLYLDDHFFLTVSDNLLVELQLIKGKDLSETVVRQLKSQQEVSVAYNIALNKLSFSMRTVGEMRQALKKSDIPVNIINQVVDRLIEQGYLEDQKFAHIYMKELIKTSHYGPNTIRQKMRQKFLSEDLIEEELLNFDSGLQEDRIRNDIIKTLNRKMSRISANKFIEKEKLKLVRWGYDLDLINHIASEFDLSQLKEEENDSLVKEGERLLARYEKLSPADKKQKIKQTLYRKGYSGSNINSFLDRFNL
ncbi:RecX family transcriptional regulator [Xylocopilactobacillus apis]|uniref:Regulatory protein RecX n=1 Tax=Xylocopilactobacillus apis TaxID=2932183 RepID=A0AAU9DMB8_9LACO|nr:RecX family transcriptional regulator [Xylocopilactobacillus apis]BDR56779.1 regulatory protein RecX [Xylocopilactobacillus apis]